MRICLNKLCHHWFRYWLVFSLHQAFIWTNDAVSKIKKKIYRSDIGFWALWSFQMLKGPSFHIKLYLLSTVLLRVSQSSNPLSKAVSDKFHRSGRYSKYNCLHDRSNFHKSRAWQIVLIFNNNDNGLSPCWRQAIIWINAEILLIGPLGTNFSAI